MASFKHVCWDSPGIALIRHSRVFSRDMFCDSTRIMLPLDIPPEILTVIHPGITLGISIGISSGISSVTASGIFQGFHRDSRRDLSWDSSRDSSNIFKGTPFEIVWGLLQDPFSNSIMDLCQSYRGSADFF